ncbi:short-subunit dehydrogenase [Hasllibacter halocynthiae]|uniref:Short-subunit dehydrogenase n=1 Tax=Hasllibacter halocynthiae TaxID=595589 RepID=A0A2T0X498_9RHOB|nr:SDR family oxidoreductase [Hasllibacter halocynthiae]PRY93747.1 short-subunit dehydrogenase [Hasllibacter halocynthiae]
MTDQIPESPIGTAVVAGGSAGIGRAVVQRLVGRGYRVGVMARGEARLREMEDEFGTDWIKGVPCDVAEADEVARAAREIVAWGGDLEIWVNSAMLTAFTPFREMPPEEFEAIVGATFLGQVNGVREALRHMQAGTIVCIGSGLSYRAVPIQSAYVASKHAVHGFVHAVRSELIAEEVPITLSEVMLPGVNTPQFDWARNRMDEHPQPAPPIYQPDVAARGVMKAIDEGLEEVIVGKPAVELIFGNMVAPHWLDRLMARKGIEGQKNDDDRTHPDRGPNTFEPAEYPSTAYGSFGDRARSSGLIIDGGTARAVAFGAPMILALGAGMAAGAALARRRR